MLEAKCATCGSEDLIMVLLKLKDGTELHYCEPCSKAAVKLYQTKEVQT